MINQNDNPFIPHKELSKNALTLAALGIVFGDIGTSPLYALKEAFHGPHAMQPTPDNIMGVLSLILWSLLLIISVKYLLFVLRADNKGEGGVLALTALAAPPRFASKFLFNKVLLLLGLFGSALLFGDGIITPAISVLSAVEGLKIATPYLQPYVVPITVLILAGLFSIQKHGTEKIGKIFGPVILLWFIVLGSLGVFGITKHPQILNAINPIYALNYFIQNGWHGFFVLGAVFLVMTGGEALYADMGHVGKNPIQRAWFTVALPGLILNYFGQGALLISNPAANENPFYFLAPHWALYPLVILATLSTVIASQALISGVFSLTRQAMQLGYAPRIRVQHTSPHEIGQIFIPHVNWMLFVLTCWCVIFFGSSSALASAYGIAVSSTMIITTVLVCAVAYQRWKWNPYLVLTILIGLLLIDFSFFAANFSKIKDGGWVPLAIATVIFILMTTWNRGRQILVKRLREKSKPLKDYLDQLQNENLIRTPGTAIFMTGDPEGTPLALMHNVRINKCLHQTNALLTILVSEDAHVPTTERLETSVVSENFYKIIVRYGFMQKPSVREILKLCKLKGLNLTFSEAYFFLGRETVLASGLPGMALWREHLFSIMARNAERATAYFDIPPDQVVEMGVQVKI